MRYWMQTSWHLNTHFNFISSVYKKQTAFVLTAYLTAEKLKNSSKTVTYAAKKIAKISLFICGFKHSVVRIEIYFRTSRNNQFSIAFIPYVVSDGNNILKCSAILTAHLTANNGFIPAKSGDGGVERIIACAKDAEKTCFWPHLCCAWLISMI